MVAPSSDQLAEGRCVSALQKASQKVDGKVVRYATRYARPEGRIKSPTTGGLARATFDAALKAGSAALSSALPNDGWIVVTKEGINVFSRMPITDGIGSHKGIVSTEMLSSVTINHGKKIGILLTFVDQSEALLVTKTRDTYPALSIWARGVADTAPAPGATDPANQEDVEPLFDASLLDIH